MSERKEYAHTRLTRDLDAKIIPRDYVKWEAEDCLRSLLLVFEAMNPNPEGQWRIDMRITPFEWPKDDAEA